MNKKMRFLVLGVLALAIIVPIFASAQIVSCGNNIDNNKETTLPGEEPCTLCNLFDLAKKIIDTLTTIIAPAIAVLAFTVGGFKILMSGPNPGLRSEGMKAIRNGVIGLLIVFGSWIIVSEFILFFVGSQNITSLAPWSQITCVPPLPPKTTTTTTTAVPVFTSEVTSPEATAMYGTQAAFTAAHNAAYDQLKIYSSIKITGTNFLCLTPQQAYVGKCTAVAYLPQNAIDGIKALVKNCNCSITITGGTEYLTHQTHGPNIAIVDLSYGSGVLTTYIVNNGTHSTDSNGCNQYTLSTGARYILETSACMSPNTTSHWHIIF